MKRAAIYARYSTDLQNDRSIDDQVAVCRAFAQRQGCSIVTVYADRAKSGASLTNRRGARDMLAAAKRGDFEVLIADSTSRIGRDQEDRAAVRKRLKFANVAIMTPVDGVVTDLTDGIRAVIDAQYIEDLKHAIRRGMSGVVRSGRHAGGRAYGYRPVKKFDANGEPVRGELEIIESEADVVRRIFELYAAGDTPRAIAAALNSDDIAPPRGKRWNASTINGNTKRGTGILQNELYVGRIVWGKVRMVKNPDTARRVSRANSDRTTVDAPQLRVVSDDVWNAAQARKSANATVRPEYQRKLSLLSGLLRCGSCGGGMTSVGGDRRQGARLQCSTFRESGACSNSRRVYRDEVTRAVLAGLQEQLRYRDAIEAYVAEYNAERRRLAKAAGSERARLERRQGELARERDRIADAICRGVDPVTFVSRSKEIAVEYSDNERKLEAMDDGGNVVRLHPMTADRYLAAVERLTEVLADRESDELISLVRGLIHSVTVHADPGGGPVRIDFEGFLAQLLDTPTKRGTVVAEEGLEPPTHGL